MFLRPWLMLLGLCSLPTAASASIKAGEASPSDDATVVPAVNVTHPASNQTESSSVQNVSYEQSAETLGVRNVPIEEGDIILPKNRNAINSIWSNAIVPYEISRDLAFRVAEIQAAFRMISASTCIRFVKHTHELNYIYIKQGEGCGSLVGVTGGGQPVYFGPTCSVGNLAHELIHALGLYHEHTRRDRDFYITINWPNIIPGKADNFQVKYGNTLNQPYDFESIMHYGTNFFSLNGNPTIVANDGSRIGQRTHLSHLDINKLRLLYRC